MKAPWIVWLSVIAVIAFCASASLTLVLTALLDGNTQGVIVHGDRGFRVHQSPGWMHASTNVNVSAGRSAGGRESVSESANEIASGLAPQRFATAAQATDGACVKDSEKNGAVGLCSLVYQIRRHGHGSGVRGRSRLENFT